MPPRTEKKAVGTTTPKKGARKTPNKTPKRAGSTPPAKNVASAEEVNAEPQVVINLNEQSAKAAASVDKTEVSNGSAPSKDSDEVREEVKPSVDEDDKGERLEVDDNEPESEPKEQDNTEEGQKEDIAAMDVDTKEVDHEGIPQEDEKEGLEDQLDDGEQEDAEEPGEDELAVDKEEAEEDMEGEGEEEEGAEEHDEPDEEKAENHEAVGCINGLSNSKLGEGDNKVKVKARLSKPHKKGRLMKHGVRGDYRIGRGSVRGSRRPWRRFPGRLEPRRFIGRGGRFVSRGSQIAGSGIKCPLGRSLVPNVPERGLSRNPPHVDRVRNRRDYGRHEEQYDGRQVRSSARSAPDFATRAAAARRSSYRDSYGPRGVSRTAIRRPYPEESHGRRVDRAYRDTVSGSKRSYSAVDEPSRYTDPSMTHSRPRMEYGVSGSASQYGDYGESARLGRGSQLSYGGVARQDSYGLYEGHQSGMGYGGSLGGSEAGGAYSSGYGNDYLSSEADIGGGSYSSLHSSRCVGGGYLGGSGSSYY